MANIHYLAKQQSYLKGSVEIKMALVSLIRTGKIEDLDDAINYLTSQVERTTNRKEKMSDRIYDLNNTNPNANQTWYQGPCRMGRIYKGKCSKAQKILNEIQDGSYDNIEDLCKKTRISRNQTCKQIKKNQKKIFKSMETA